MSEAEWRSIGITQSLGWVHYEVHGEWSHLIYRSNDWSIAPSSSTGTTRPPVPSRARIPTPTSAHSERSSSYTWEQVLQQEVRISDGSLLRTWIGLLGLSMCVASPISWHPFIGYLPLIPILPFFSFMAPQSLGTCLCHCELVIATLPPRYVVLLCTHVSILRMLTIKYPILQSLFRRINEIPSWMSHTRLHRTYSYPLCKAIVYCNSITFSVLHPSCGSMPWLTTSAQPYLWQFAWNHTIPKCYRWLVLCYTYHLDDRQALVSTYSLVSHQTFDTITNGNTNRSSQWR